MPPRCSHNSNLLPNFLYPFLALPPRQNAFRAFAASSRRGANSSLPASSELAANDEDLPPHLNSHLNPAPDDYSSTHFADKARLRILAGPGGNGCVSFLREAYFPDGPPNGGDGGHGGNVYIQAVAGETSLLKLSRNRFVRAGRGKHGRGSAQAGQKGDDVVITVPVGTVVRELERHDPVAEEALMDKIRKKERKRRRQADAAAKAAGGEGGREETDGSQRPEASRQGVEEEVEEEHHKWVMYPGLSKTDREGTNFPTLPKRDRQFFQPPAPIILDLRRPTPTPLLLAAGGLGGLGNPHFASQEMPRPQIATKGELAVSMNIDLELKLLADVGLVGLPNAGKSTLLRSLTNSRTRVGSWAFTTLQPNIGTVVLDKYRGRPVVRSYIRYPAAPDLGLPEEEVAVEPRTRFTIADIPGLVEGAHLNRGLGIEFLRHVERARVLAFVIDLAAGNAVKALRALWNEVGLYAQMREEEDHDRDVEARVDWSLSSDLTDGSSSSPAHPAHASPYSGGAGQSIIADDYTTSDPPPDPAGAGLHIASKPWFVVATKADLPETKANFEELRDYVEEIAAGKSSHPTGLADAWTKSCVAIPVSAIHGHNVEGIVHWTVRLLDDPDA